MEIEHMISHLKKYLKKLKNSDYFLSKVYRKLTEVYMYFKYIHICRQNPIDSKMVFFESFLGKQVACSPKALYECMLQDERFNDYTFVWALRSAKKKKAPELLHNDRTIIVQYKSRNYYKYLSMSKYWITNWRLPTFITKKKEQVLIQTWHGTPLKKIGLDSTIESNPLTSQKRSHKIYLKDSRNYDYLVSPSAFCTRVFTTAFGLDKLHKEDILIETGYPRNDFLLNYKESDVLAVKESLGLPLDKKIILYAPTWRDNEHTLGVGNTFDIEKHFCQFMDTVSDDYIIIVRLHYLVASKVDLSRYEGKVFNFSNLDDINQLYIISDILITDYSSVFFDYANLNKPILFYMYDLEEYQTQIRDFYFDLAELPGPIIQTQEELLDAVYHVDEISQEYAERYQIFCEKYNSLDDGQASRRVLDICIPAEK